MFTTTLRLLTFSSLLVLLTTFGVNTHAEPQLLWGDTHLHTSYSFDAFLNGNQTADPNTAYAFATGQPVIHPGTRARVQLNTPLDFLVIADHAEFYGGISDIYYKGIQKPDPSLLERIAFWYTENEIRDAIDSVIDREAFNAEVDAERQDAAQLDTLRATVHKTIGAIELEGGAA